MIYFVIKIDCYLRSASCLHAEIGVGESESDPLPVSHTLNHVGDLASRKASSRKAKGAIHVINIQDQKPHEGIRSYLADWEVRQKEIAAWKEEGEAAKEKYSLWEVKSYNIGREHAGCSCSMNRPISQTFWPEMIINILTFLAHLFNN